MPKIIVLYWEPGSCGDFVSQVLLGCPAEYQGIMEKMHLTEQGRVSPRLKKFFVEKLGGNTDQLYLREWSLRDCDIISNFVVNLDCKYFVLPTHRIDQVDFLKSQFDQSISMGITYPKNMFPLILKNWCKKVAASDTGIQKIYNDPVHHYLQLKNKFGEFVLTEQLKYGSKIKTNVENAFNIEIPLEDLYNSSLDCLYTLFYNNSHVDYFFNDWIQRQNKIHRYCYNIPDILKQALGYNSKSKDHGELAVCLDIFDNMLIKHHCSRFDLPTFKTLQQAADFFKHYSAAR